MRGKAQRRQPLAIEMPISTEEQHEESYPQPARSLAVRQAEVLSVLSGKIPPRELKCRDNETKKIKAVLDGFFTKGKRVKFLMVTGSPGVGKTLTLTTLLQAYSLVKINANTVKTIAEVQHILLTKILGEVPTNRAEMQRKLDKVVWDHPTVLYIEEIQTLLNRAPKTGCQNFMDLFSGTYKLAMVGVSNNIGVLQKYGQKLNIGQWQIENVTFSPYTIEQAISLIHQQLQQAEARSELSFEYPEKLLRFSVTKLQMLKQGDFRIYLQFLKTLIKIVFQEEQKHSITQPFLITSNHVAKAFSGLQKSTFTLMPLLPYQQQLLLIALYINLNADHQLYAEMNKLKLDLKWICDSLHLDYNKQNIAESLSELELYSFVKLKKNKNKQLIQLNVSLTDIKFIFENHALYAKLFKQ